MRLKLDETICSRKEARDNIMDVDDMHEDQIEE